ncbi:MAG: malate dehydrogenase, partial [Candidatus Bathyarchaeota archaeon]|nr:malate dehydrogenase [Candidatus Bathyarchaeota archaeon]
DIQEGLAQGETLDITQASPSIGFDGVIKGSSDFADMAGSELVIITAGYPRKPNTSRRDLALGNAKIITSVVREVVKYAPECNLMIVTNPVDAMTYIAYKRSGFHRSKVFGMSGILDTSRYRSYLASELNISRKDINGLVIGEHGDLMIPLIDYTTISGIPISDLLESERIEKIVETARYSAMDVIKLKGATVHAPASAVALMVDSIINDRKRLVCVSVIPDGEYGLKDISIGLPVVLGKNGIEKIIELDLDRNIKSRLSDAASSIGSVISQIHSE